ncbi:hypothetical protein [Streptomyces tendae]|uniref:hypothetical protein n=1 Tax=Streptomyces tendae TaxID=1932 RepID=UPI00368EFE4C
MTATPVFSDSGPRNPKTIRKHQRELDRADPGTNRVLVGILAKLWAAEAVAYQIALDELTDAERAALPLLVDADYVAVWTNRKRGERVGLTAESLSRD